MGNNIEANRMVVSSPKVVSSPPVDVLDILTTNFEDEQKIGAFFASKPNLLNEFVDSFSLPQILNLIFFSATCRST